MSSLEDKPDVSGQVTEESTSPTKHSTTHSILTKLSFLRPTSDDSSIVNVPSGENGSSQDGTSKKAARAMSVVVQQKTRKRKGSLRKAALLGRGAQREKKELEASPLTNGGTPVFPVVRLGIEMTTPPEEIGQSDGTGAEAQNEAPDTRPLENSQSSGSGHLPQTVTGTVTGSSSTENPDSPSGTKSPDLMYTSTTDDEDVLSIAKQPTLRAGDSSIGKNYFQQTTLQRRRSHSKPSPAPLSLKNLDALTTFSPLNGKTHAVAHGSSGPSALAPSLSNLSSKSLSSVNSKLLSNNNMISLTLPPTSSDWDYAETERWGWVILFTTWVTFVIGMGSCLGVWSWCWETPTGETPKAPPELSNDDTLPITGYYPVLIVLTGVMAWVWVLAAWVGMKYFRHAKI